MCHIGKELVNRGHNVTMVSIAVARGHKAEKAIESAGLNFVTTEDSLTEEALHPQGSEADALEFARLFKEILMGMDKVDIVIGDIFSFTTVPVAEELGILTAVNLPLIMPINELLMNNAMNSKHQTVCCGVLCQC